MKTEEVAPKRSPRSTNPTLPDRRREAEVDGRLAEPNQSSSTIEVHVLLGLRGLPMHFLSEPLARLPEVELLEQVRHGCVDQLEQPITPVPLTVRRSAGGRSGRSATTSSNAWMIGCSTYMTSAGSSSMNSRAAWIQK